MKWGKKVIRIKLDGVTFPCAQREWEKATALKLRTCFVCREKQLSVSLPTNGYVDHVWTRIILWWKGHITKTATCKGVLPAAAPHCSTWAFQMWTSLTSLCIRNAAEVTEVEEQQMSSERNIEVDKHNWSGLCKNCLYTCSWSTETLLTKQENNDRYSIWLI